MDNKSNGLEIKNHEITSKTKLKKNMKDLQNIGLRLTTISKAQLIKINIPTGLITEIDNYKKIISNTASKRQLQYIRKLISKLNEQDIKKIINYFTIIDGKNKIYQSKLKQIDNIIKHLLEDDKYLTEYVVQNKNINTTEIRMLIRNIKKTQIDNKPTKYYKLLYNSIKEIENNN